ncbi:MAG: PKD domain-containing protein [Thermoplasmatota archaeon]
MILSVLSVISGPNGISSSGSPCFEPFFSGGSGTASDPYKISNVTELQWMGNTSNLDKHFILVNDINASATKTWNSGAGFVPIGTGTSLNTFTGSLDGNGYNITGLFINRSGTDYQGLFGYIDTGGVVKNVILIDSEITGNSYVGGMVGSNKGTVSNCCNVGNVSADGTSHLSGFYVGGIVGENEGGTIFTCHARGNVSGGIGVGGLIGFNSGGGTLTNCSATVSVNGDNSVGGLVGGYDESEIFNSFYNFEKGLINGVNHLTMGGLYEDQYRDWISNGLSLDIHDYSTSLVPSGDRYEIDNVQGIKDLLGFAWDNEYRFCLSEDIDLSSDPGLFIPYFGASEFDGNNHTISHLYLDFPNSMMAMFGINQGGIIRDLGVINGEVNGTDVVGGLIGYNERGNVFDCFTTGSVNGRWVVGGLVGDNHDGTIFASHAKGNVSGGMGVGGLIGYNSDGGTLTNCYATGSVNSYTRVGGLVGYNNFGTVVSCYATGPVSGDTRIGGLIGLNIETPLFDCYATGPVSGDTKVGGLVGEAKLVVGANNGIISNCYATGPVNGTGGLVGDNYAYNVSNSFWDTITTGQVLSSGGTGKTTSEMKMKSTFIEAGWDLIDVWHMIENVTYPLLRWQDGGYPYAEAGPDLIIDEDTLISFDGSASWDGNGIAHYGWTFTDETDIELEGVKPTYCFNNPGVFLVTLNVTNTVGNWDIDSFTVIVNDITPPVANAGPDRTIGVGTSFTFNGSGSHDNVGVASYTWSFTDTIPIVLTGVQTTYRFNYTGVYPITLNVTDAAGHWNTDTMTVTVLDITSPVADAGPDRTISVGASFTVNGSGSHDNVEIINWTWTFYDGIENITIYGSDPSHIFKVPGVFLVTLNVTDAAGNWATDSMIVTVNDNTQPIADAGTDQTVDEGTIVTFDGVGSSDNVGIVNYTWSFIDGVPITLYGAQAEYQFNDPGVFVVILNVTDDAGNWATATMTVTVRDITSPVANAGSDQRVAIGSTVILNGSLSTDNVGIVRHTWTFNYDGAQRTLEGAEVEFKFDKSGTYEIDLTVYDEYENIGMDTLNITVVDTGVVKGMVLDKDGDPVQGAVVEITASNGEIHTAATGSDGTFSIEIYHGAFSWKITKDGYRSISGNGSVNALEETVIDLSGCPLTKEGKSAIILIILPILLLILILVGVAIFLISRRKREVFMEE